MGVVYGTVPGEGYIPLVFNVIGDRNRFGSLSPGHSFVRGRSRVVIDDRYGYREEPIGALLNELLQELAQEDRALVGANTYSYMDYGI